jgi:hypothetical protein
MAVMGLRAIKQQANTVQQAIVDVRTTGDELLNMNVHTIKQLNIGQYHLACLCIFDYSNLVLQTKSKGLSVRLLKLLRVLNYCVY